MNAITPNLPAVIIENATPLPTSLREALETAADLAAASTAASTRAAYASDFRIFSTWCAEHGLTPLPATPAAVAAFIGDQAAGGMKVSTLGRRVAAIKIFHKKANEASPTDDERVKSVVRGARRTLGVAPRRMAPALVEMIRDMARATPPGLKGLRDRALLLVGWSGALRRSEIVALNLDDIEWTDDGLRITIRRSKGDQDGQGQQIAIVRGSVCCPVKALRTWLDAAGIVSGPIFRRVLRGNHATDRRLTAQSVCKLAKHYAEKIGLNGADFGAHSLRSGPLTSASARGASLIKLKELSRHKGTDVLVNHYIRPNDLFRDHCLSNLL